MIDQAPWQLLFYPDDPQWCPVSASRLEAALNSVGLIGQPWIAAGTNRFLIGPTFLQYISFLGCAPVVQFDPADGKSIIHWVISPCLSKPRWVIDMVQGLPRCHCCKGRVTDWREQFQNLTATPLPDSVTCPQCHQPNQLTELDWRHSAGYARQFISIVNVYPREAIPTDAVLSALQQQTGVTWQYFYCQCDPIL